MSHDADRERSPAELSAIERLHIAAKRGTLTPPRGLIYVR